jgi:hypothetical protein
MSNQDTRIYNGTVWGALFQGPAPSGESVFFGPGEGAPRPHRGQNIPGAGGFFPLPDFDLIPSGASAVTRGRRGPEVLYPAPGTGPGAGAAPGALTTPLTPLSPLTPPIPQTGPTSPFLGIGPPEIVPQAHGQVETGGLTYYRAPPPPPPARLPVSRGPRPAGAHPGRQL